MYTSYVRKGGIFMKSTTLKIYGENHTPEKDFPEAIARKRTHVEMVTKYVEYFATEDMDYELLHFCAKHHDDGRGIQYIDQGGKLDDRKKSHSEYGTEMFLNFIHERNLKLDSEAQICLDVIKYHGYPGNLTELPISDESRKYVEAVRSADSLENAVSCVSYLLINVKYDEKGYVEENPQLDQTFVSDEVWKHFVKGEKFDKLKLCHTYAEYILFASTLATDAVRKMEKIARKIMHSPGYGYSSIMEGYKHIFNEVLSKEMAPKAYEIFAKNIG